MLVHGFTTERYLREVTIPALERGAAKAGKTRRDLDVVLPRLRGDREADQAEMAKAATAVSARSPSTARPPPTGRSSSCTAGASSATELNTMSKRGEWEAMGELITDEMLDAFAVVGPLDDVAG